MELLSGIILLVCAIYVLLSIPDELKTGTLRHRGGKTKRVNHPHQFIIGIVLQGVLGIFLLGLAIYYLWLQWIIKF
jgi:hypothetical protein